MNKLLLAALLIFCLACNHSSSKKKIEDYYHKYLIALSDPSTNVHCVASFREEGDSGSFILLPEETSVYLDDKKLPQSASDSVYRVLKDKKGFNGNHIWKLKYNDEVIAEVPVYFTSFEISGKVDSIMGDKEVLIRINGLKDGDKVECWFDNVNEEMDEETFTYTVRNNMFTIPVADIRKHRPGRYDLLVNSMDRKPVIINGRKAGVSEVMHELDDIPVTIKYP